MINQATKSDKLISKGASHMLRSTLWFAGMNICAKLVNHLPAMEVVFFRCAVALSFCLFYLQRNSISWTGSNRKLLFLRGAFGTLALYWYFLTLHHMPLGSAVTIQYLSPIFSVIAAIFILNEKVKLPQWFFFLISFAGVILIKGFDERVSVYYLMIGIGSAIFSALAYNMIRTIKGKEHPIVVVLHFMLIGTITGFVFTLFNFKMPQGWDWLFLILVGVFTQLGQVQMTKSLQLANIAEVSILVYTGVIYALVAGYFIFNETYGAVAIVGILLVIGGVIMNILYGRKKLSEGESAEIKL
ncbi:MAG: DMT family transporter [Bacteroidia bacterium]